MIDIIKKDLHIVKGCKQLILQPQNAMAEIRQFLHQIDMKIEKENFVEDQGKYYPILYVTHGEESYAHEVEYVYGKYLLMHPTPDFYTYMDHKKDQLATISKALDTIDTPTAQERRMTLAHEKKLYEEALVWLH